MKNHEHEELLWNNPEIEIEYDIMEAEQEYDGIGLSSRLKNKLRSDKMKIAFNSS